MSHSIGLTLVECLSKKNILFEWLEDVWQGESSIAIFNHEKTLSIHCHQVSSGIAYCFFDSKTTQCTIEWRLHSVTEMIYNFDRFILCQSSNELIYNPYFDT